MVQMLRDSCCAPCVYWAVPFLVACGLGTNLVKNQHLYPRDAVGNASQQAHTAEREFSLWRECYRSEGVARTEGVARAAVTPEFGPLNQKQCTLLETDNQSAGADCGKFERVTRATRAFYIISLILAVFTLLALIAASCGTISWLIPAILIVLVAIFLLIAVILAAHMYDRSDKANGAFCNLAQSYVNGSFKHFELQQVSFVNGTRIIGGDRDAIVKPDVGPSIPLMATAWFLNAFAGCWNCALKDGKEAFQKVAPYGEY